jgi:hypothetical protein
MAADETLAASVRPIRVEGSSSLEAPYAVAHGGRPSTGYRYRFLENQHMERTWREKIEGTTDQILAQIKRLLDEGNIRRVLVKQQGRVVAEFPLTVGVVGTVIAPLAAAIGALTAVLADCTIEVEKTAADAPESPVTPPAGPEPGPEPGNDGGNDVRPAV